jgi:hypothetical protein
MVRRRSLLLAALLLLAVASRARAEEGPTVIVSTGQLGMRREVPHALAIDVQVGVPWRLRLIRPVAGVLTSSMGGAYLYSGFALDLPLAGNLRLSPGFAPGVVLASADRDLGSRIEFRSSIELWFAATDAAQMGLTFSHISNARLSSHNPGVEVLTFSIALPARR